jgi:hypothetical protein
MFRRAVVPLVVVPGAAALADRAPTRDHIGRHRITEAAGVNALTKGAADAQHVRLVRRPLTAGMVSRVGIEPTTRRLRVRLGDVRWMPPSYFAQRIHQSSSAVCRQIHLIPPALGSNLGSA